MIEPVRIEPEALYDDGSLRQALGLTPATLAAARRPDRSATPAPGSGSSTKGLGFRLGSKRPPRPPRSPARGRRPGWVTNDTSPPPQGRLGRSWPPQAGRSDRPPARGPGRAPCPPASSRCSRSMTWPPLELLPPPRGADAIRRQGSQARHQDRQDAPMEGRHDSSLDRKGWPPMTISPPDAWTFRRLLTGHDAERGTGCPARRPERDGRAPGRLGQEARTDRLAAMLAARPDRDELVKTLEAIDPNGTRPGERSNVDLLTWETWPASRAPDDSSGRHWLVSGHFNLLSSDPKIGKTHLALFLAWLIWFREAMARRSAPDVPREDSDALGLWRSASRRTEGARRRVRTTPRGCSPQRPACGALRGVGSGQPR